MYMLKGTSPFMKKRNRVLRFVALATIAAAGTGIALLASNEDGRAKLARARDVAARSALNAAEYLSASWQSASQWVESNRNQNEANAYPSDHQHYQQNGASEYQHDLSYTR
jgi:hypothetical protein